MRGTCPSVLSFSYVSGLETLVTLGDFKSYCFALCESFEAITCDLRVMCKDVCTVVLRDEPEALGCIVSFPNSDGGVPFIEKKLLDNVTEVDKLKRIDVEKTGRMPLMLEATNRVHEALGNEVFVRGSISGPYSIAAELAGIEPLMVACLTQPERMLQLPNMKQIIPTLSSRRQWQLHLAALACLIGAYWLPSISDLAALLLLADFGWLWWSLRQAHRIYQSHTQAH